MQLNQGIDQMSQVVQTNSATAQEGAAASEELSGQAEMLKERIASFKLNNARQDTVWEEKAVLNTKSTTTIGRTGVFVSDKY